MPHIALVLALLLSPITHDATTVEGFTYHARKDPMTDADTSYLVTEDGRSALFVTCTGKKLDKVSVQVRTGRAVWGTTIVAGSQGRIVDAAERFDSGKPTNVWYEIRTTVDGHLDVLRNKQFMQAALGSSRVTVQITDKGYEDTVTTMTFSLANLRQELSRLPCAKDVIK